MEKKDHILRIAFAVFLIILGLCYWPGVDGGFIFDDAVNLKNLGLFGPVDNWRSFFLYVTSGKADPTGRPISMLSFLWDANNWPADAAQFKKTNILIHLLNAALLFKALHIVERKLGNNSQRATAIAALGAALWAAHPFFVSTTLYVVQRHAMLPLTFTLLAWLCWAQTEKWLDTSNTRKAWILAFFGVWGMTALAGLSKANGFLAPLLILVSFSILNVGQRKTISNMPLKIIILGIPSLAIVSYLILQLRYGFDVSYNRDFTLGERLLTQPRIMYIYLSELLLPGVSNHGFYFGDTIEVSRSLFQPISTLFSIVLLLASVTIAWIYKTRYPRIALATMWFVLGHLVESSTIMLELYFEHRNYLPSAFLFIPLAHWLICGNILPRTRKILTILVPSLLLSITLNKAIIWGSPVLQAKIWDHTNADSYRNVINAATQVRSQYDLDIATGKIRDLITKNPNSINLYLGLIGTECELEGSNEETWAKAYNAARTDNDFNAGIIDWLSHAIRVASLGSCNNLDSAKMRILLDAFAENPSHKNKDTSESVLQHLKGFLEALSGDYTSALLHFNNAIKIRKDPHFVLTQAALLGNLGQEALAIKHIEYYRSLVKPPENRSYDMSTVHQMLLSHFKYFDSELDLLERKLKATKPDTNKHP